MKKTILCAALISFAAFAAAGFAPTLPIFTWTPEEPPDFSSGF